MIHIPEDVYPYLVAQRGALDDMKIDPVRWCEKYFESLMSDFKCIEPFLPERCDAVLDVGGGMGGINILLNEFYGGHLIVALLDGVDDQPNVARHAETFSNYRIARNFLRINGVENTLSVDPTKPFAPNFFDLVISLKSWCFHYEPARYLQFVKSCAIEGRTKIIVDVRGGAKGADDQRSFDWQRELSGAFGSGTRIHWGVKSETMCYTR